MIKAQIRTISRIAEALTKRRGEVWRKELWECFLEKGVPEMNSRMSRISQVKKDG